MVHWKKSMINQINEMKIFIYFHHIWNRVANTVKNSVSLWFDCVPVRNAFMCGLFVYPQEKLPCL